MKKKVISVLIAMFLLLNQMVVGYATSLPEPEPSVSEGMPTSAMLKDIIDKQLKLKQYQDNVSYPKFEMIGNPKILESVWVLDTTAQSSSPVETFNITDSMISDNNVNLYRSIIRLSDYYFKDGDYGMFGYVIFAQDKNNLTDIDVVEYCMSYIDTNLNTASIPASESQKQLYYSFPSQLYKLENDKILPIDMVTEELSTGISDPIETDMNSYFLDKNADIPETYAIQYVPPSNYSSELRNYAKIFKFKTTLGSTTSGEFMSNKNIIDSYSNRFSNIGVTDLSHSNLRFSAGRTAKYIFGGNQLDFRNFNFMAYGCGYIAMANTYFYLNETLKGDFFKVEKQSDGLTGTNDYMQKITHNLTQKIISIKNEHSPFPTYLFKGPEEALSPLDLEARVGFTVPTFIYSLEQDVMIDEDSAYNWKSNYRILSNTYVSSPATESTSNPTELDSNHNNAEYKLSEVIRFVTDSFKDSRPVLFVSRKFDKSYDDTIHTPPDNQPNEMDIFNSLKGHVVTLVRIYRVNSTMPHFVVTSNRGSEIGYNLDILSNAYGKTDSGSILDENGKTDRIGQRLFISIGVKNMGAK